MRKYSSKVSVTAILCSDMHLREDTPVCRTDNYWDAQWRKVGFIKRLQKQYNCPVLHAGDLFDFWKPSPYLLTETIRHLPNNFWTIYGQHDLPAHNLELAYKCGINTLLYADKLAVMKECHYNQTPEMGSLIFPYLKHEKILVWHIMTYTGTPPYPGAPNPAHELLKKYPEYSLIVTGDNHKTFTVQLDGRLLVNPGSMMRLEADQVDHQPCVFLWYAESNTVEVVYLPIENNVISREHITIQQQRNERIDAFISRLDDDWEVSVSFEENLKQFMATNQIRQSVKDIIFKSIEI